MWVAIGVFTFFVLLLMLTVFSVLRTGNKAPTRIEAVARYAMKRYARENLAEEAHFGWKKKIHLFSLSFRRFVLACLLCLHLIYYTQIQTPSKENVNFSSSWKTALNAHACMVTLTFDLAFVLRVYTAG